MAVTFAEAGEWKTAENYLDKLRALNESKKPKLVVVALDAAFSQGTIDYTVNLADRMRYDVLAINVRHSRGCQRIIHGKSTKHLSVESRESFQSLVEKTSKHNIRCECLVSVEDIRLLLHKVRRMIKRIEILLVQTDRAKNLSLQLDIPVFQIAST